MNKKLRIVFMGTPDFAVISLDILVKNGYNIVGVITSADKPAGRGKKIQQSAIKKYAIDNNLLVLQPEKLKDTGFLKQLSKLKADLQVVVAFRMLPEVIWKTPPLGTVNLHASLLPHYRGAAPINWAIINGEKETGITTFFIKHEIDAGEIIFQRKIMIPDNQTAGDLHDRLMNLGSKLVLKTVKAIKKGSFSKTDQASLYLDTDKFKPAPKIFKKDCKINWNKNIIDIHNHIRGLSPYPGAWTEITSPERGKFSLKIFISSKDEVKHKHKIGNIVTDGKTNLKIAVQNGFIKLLNVQMAGKKILNIDEFLRGYKIDPEKSGWKTE